MIVLSLFDGISCGRVAFERAGIPVTKYYASEIDKYATQISEKNWPDIIRLGDVTKWREWDIEQPDFIIAGSPCQGFSNAGAGLNFDDPRSALYFEFEKILEKYDPKYWILENVRMKTEWADIIDTRLSVGRVLINSARVSAQNRQRFYWANFHITQPEDKGILLKDVVLSDAYPVALHNLYGGFEEDKARTFKGKSPTIRTAAGGGHIHHFVLKTFADAVIENGSLIGVDQYRRELTGKHMDKSHAVLSSNYKGLNRNQSQTAVIDLDALVHSEKAIEYMNRPREDGRTGWDFAHHSDVENEKSAAVVANFFKGVPYNVFKDWNCIRKFHPIECERLQTLPDNYTEGVSNTQRYKSIGNGWTVDVISHILSCRDEKIEQQLSFL